MLDKDTKKTIEELTIAVEMVERATSVFQEVNEKLDYLPKAQEELVGFRKELQNLKNDTATELKKQINTAELEKISLQAVKTLDYLADETIPALQKAAEEQKRARRSSGFKNILIGLVIGGAATFGYMSHFLFKMEKNLTPFVVQYYEDVNQKIIGIPNTMFHKQDTNHAYFKINKNKNTKQKGSK
ncbi:hypothetical protein [Sulfurimonas sp.]|uniref:hypothetical protein n=1 Tax=Sulfurimonas sp. TaxID=2022749 RepID=UPI0025CC5871|nr:hypothetical protein [Sulfurimonas sp.]MBW6488997.1 hypothetical protein [Sulfurimonas sp.]